MEATVLGLETVPSLVTNREELVINVGLLQTDRVQIVEVQPSLEEEISVDHPIFGTPFKEVNAPPIMLVSLQGSPIDLSEVTTTVEDQVTVQVGYKIGSVLEQVNKHPLVGYS